MREGEDVDEGKEEDDEEARLVGSLELPEGWADGKFDVNINRCDDCHFHYQYSRHSEDEFVNQFNDLGDAIQGVFPSAVILGNEEKVQMLDEFEVFLRGIGFKSQRDARERFILFRKS